MWNSRTFPGPFEQIEGPSVPNKITYYYIQKNVLFLNSATKWAVQDLLLGKNRASYDKQLILIIFYSQRLKCCSFQDSQGKQPIFKDFPEPEMFFCQFKDFPGFKYFKICFEFVYMHMSPIHLNQPQLNTAFCKIHSRVGPKCSFYVELMSQNLTK